MGEPRDEDIQFLAHHGVKGMKWGVRKEDKPAGKRSSGKDKEPKSTVSSGESALKAKWMAIRSPKLGSKKQQVQELADNNQKFMDKFEGGGSKKADSADGEKKKGWRPTGKQVAVGIGIAFVAYSLYKGGKRIQLPPGQPCSLNDFKTATFQSKMASWTGQGYIKPSSYLQDEFTLPAGHTFHRIATRAETSFRGATYTTSSTTDFNRYVAAFRGEKKGVKDFYHVTWKSTEDIKVPSLVTRLETLKEVLNEEAATSKYMSGMKHSDASVKAQYQKLSGGSWDSSLATKFISALKAKGFDAIIDDMDAGVIGDAPLVAFNPSKFGSKVSTIMSTADIKAAESSLVELLNRK